MSFIEAEILKEVLPKPAAGPDGFDVHYEFKDGAHIDAGSQTVEAQLNEQSLAHAQARNEGGSNKQLAAMNPPKPAVGSALSFIDSQHAKADSMYGAMIAKRGLMPAIERATMTPSSGGRRQDHRHVMARAPSLKDPLERNKRRLLQLRRTFDEISAQKQKTTKLNPEMLPQIAKDKIIREALQKGEQNTPFGPVASHGTARALGRVAMHGARVAFNKWDAVGALMGGSFVDLSPRLKRS